MSPRPTATADPVEVRPLRFCDICGGLDDHPRHVTLVTEGGVPTDEFLDALPEGAPVAAVAQLMDPTTVIRHMDCCAANGCPTCAATEAHIAVKVSGDTRGQDLIDAIVDGRVLDDLEVAPSGEPI